MPHADARDGPCVRPRRGRKQREQQGRHGFFDNVGQEGVMIRRVGNMTCAALTPRSPPRLPYPTRSVRYSKSQHRDRTHARTDTQRQAHQAQDTADTQTADTHTSESQPRPKHTHRPRPPQSQPTPHARAPFNPRGAQPRVRRAAARAPPPTPPAPRRASPPRAAAACRARWPSAAPARVSPTSWDWR